MKKKDGRAPLTPGHTADHAACFTVLIWGLGSLSLLAITLVATIVLKVKPWAKQEQAAPAAAEEDAQRMEPSAGER